MTVTCGAGLYRLRAEVVSMGEDLCVAVTGGERPHLGCAALGEPHPALDGSGRMGATVSLLNRTGHRDGVVAERVCKRLCAALGRSVAVTCGIHVDGIGPEGIGAVLAQADELAEAILRAIGGEGV